MKRFGFLLAVCLLIGACGPKQLEPDAATDCWNCDDWNRPQEPFRIYGNTWYVGTAGLSSILIEAGDGLILIDGGLTQSSALIDSNIRSAGFDPLKISAILVSHAHYDHAGGVAALQHLTGATVYTSVEGAKVLKSGQLQRDDPQFLHGPANSSFPAIKNVVAIEDRAIVSVGDVNMTAVYTPGHTPGSTSWTWESCALGNCYDIVYADSLTAVSAEGYRFSDGPAANQLVESAGAISDLDCDILLSPHPFFFGMQDKLENRKEGNPFVNNVGCMIYAESALDWLQQRLESEGS
ncbi:MAG: subclass B3 metallo-beta-lactamase [Woeseiaceae bacterium]|nr:subclass B3 metallo-beta-lactamase [Woeseiaceae bacterium]